MNLENSTNNRSTIANSAENSLNPANNSIGGGSGVTPLEIQTDDLEDGIIRADYNQGIFDDNELIHFIEKHTLSEGFYDYYDQMLPNIFEHPNMTTNILWVENPVTGKFHPVRKNGKAAENIITESNNPNNLVEQENILENIPLIPKINLNDDAENQTPSGANEAILVPPNPQVAHISLKNDNRELTERDEWTIMTMEYRNSNFRKRLFFLFFQALLAGFCFLGIYVEFGSKNNRSLFLTNYQPLAQETRRFFYFITTISLIGSMDYALTLWAAQVIRNPLLDNLSKDVAAKIEDYQKTTLFIGIIVLLLHFIAFISSIVISFYDVQIFLKYGFVEPSSTIVSALPAWTKYALAKPKYVKYLDQWQLCDRIRTYTCLIAWLGCCVLLWRDISRYSKVWFNIRRIKQTAFAWMQRAKMLEGNGDLDKLSPIELKEVIGSLEVGLQRAKNALNVLEHDDNVGSVFMGNLGQGSISGSPNKKFM